MTGAGAGIWQGLETLGLASKDKTQQAKLAEQKLTALLEDKAQAQVHCSLEYIYTQNEYWLENILPLP